MVNKLIEQNLYNDILRNMPIVCVDLLIFCPTNCQYLLVRRKDEPLKDQLYFPGGRLFKNEKSEEAAIRIAKSEVGLNCSIRKFLGVYETIFQNGPYNIPVHSVNLTYYLHTSTNKVKLDDHHSEFQWVNASRIPPELDHNLRDFIYNVFGEGI